MKKLSIQMYQEAFQKFENYCNINGIKKNSITYKKHQVAFYNGLMTLVEKPNQAVEICVSTGRSVFDFITKNII